MKKTTVLHPHSDPPQRPQKQHRSSEEAEAELGHDTVHQKPFLLQLPNCTIVDFHCRIPIKTLIKCRRVCKPWRSLFSDPRFTKDLLSRTPACHLVIASSGTYYLLDFNDASTPNDVTALRTRFLSSSDGFVGSCNVFLCLYNKERNRQDSFRPKSVQELVFQSCSAFGFGFSPISDVYKVVFFTSSRLIEATSPREFGLSRGPEKVTVLIVGSGSWRHIGDSVMGEFDHQSGIYLNGYLHWIGRTTLDYDIKESWAKELDMGVKYGAASGSSTQALNFSKERQVLLLQNRLQAHILGIKGFVGIEVDGMKPLIDASYLHIPSFVSLKDVLGGQNLMSGRFEKLRIRDAGELQRPAPNETIVSSRPCRSQQRPGSMKANAADRGSAETDQRNLLPKGTVRSKSAVVENKQQASPSSSLPTQPSVSLPLTGNQSKSPAKRKKAPEKKQL
ncbi:hypothetical protein ACLB2K_035191 [Fragaria x ananassa]